MANPSVKLDRIVPNKPIKMMGFRPNRSDKVPQIMAVLASAIAKAETKTPAQKEAF